MRLNPFENDAPFQVDVDASVTSQGGLEVEWSVNGPLPTLGECTLKGRAERLWLDTVFEVFGRFDNSEAYWETNLSPKGLWNSYSFSGYRQGMTQTQSVIVTGLEWLVRKEREWRFVSAYHFEAQSESLTLGLACIIHPGPYHFALRHGGSRPDFHANESFALRV